MTGIETNNAERSQTRLNFGFQTGLLAAKFFMVRDQLFEQPAVSIGLTINRMHSIQAQQLGKFAGIDGIVFDGIFTDPRQSARV